MTTKRFRLHDTLTRERHEIRADDGETLRFYCCGPTVYGPSHIGNFRAFLAQDLFRRVAELAGFKTKHVRNITDVDDKTIRVSQEVGETLQDFTEGWTKSFHEDAASLNLLKPHVEPAATAHIPEQIALIEDLIAKGNAYASEDGSVYFGVSSYEPYGKLTRIDQRELQSGAGETANDADEYEKDNVCDFVALGRRGKPEDGANFWESPWGEGRPGWHLECSAMGMKYLGESFDLHAGGVDLCFPHHENEIAQSEASTGKAFARHWFHNEHLMVDGGKMAKSSGTLYTLGDLEKMGYSAAELRYSLLAGSYRSKINFSVDRLDEARGNLQRVANFVAALEGELPDYVQLAQSGAAGELDFGPFADAWEAMLDDLNTAAALGAFFSALKPLERSVANGSLDDAAKSAARTGIAGIIAAFGWVLPEPEAAQAVSEAPADIREIAEQRIAAKAEKNWGEADRLRDEIAAAGWAVVDTKDGYELKPA